MGRMLGIDYGDKRIGLAISDPTGLIATALEVLPGDAPAQSAKAIGKICREKQVERIVIGWPRNMDGSEGEAVEKVAVFIERLTSINLPIIKWDERMSTVTAQATLIEAGTRRKKRKGLVDKVAAQVILQNYLDSL